MQPHLRQASRFRRRRPADARSCIRRRRRPARAGRADRRRPGQLRPRAPPARESSACRQIPSAALRPDRTDTCDPQGHRPPPPLSGCPQRPGARRHAFPSRRVARPGLSGGTVSPSVYATAEVASSSVCYLFAEFRTADMSPKLTRPGSKIVHRLEASCRVQIVVD